VFAAALVSGCGEKKQEASAVGDAGGNAAPAGTKADASTGAKAEGAAEPWISGSELGDWKALDIAGAGKVEVRNGELTMGAGEGMTGVVYAGKREIPVVDYELSWEAVKLQGVDFFGAASFPVRDRKTCATFINGGWGGGVTGISCIDGSAANDNKTCSYQQYEEGKWYRFRVMVTADVIQAWVDDKRVVNCDIKGAHISLRFGDIEGCAPFGFATWMTKGSVRNIAFRKLKPGEGKGDQDTF
jgi:hypothetical protein